MLVRLKKYFPNSGIIGLLVLAFLIRLYIFARRKDDATTLDIYNLLQIGITFLLGVILFFKKSTHSIVKFILKSPLGWLVILYSFGILSGIWSAIPRFSSYFGLEGLIYVVALAYIFYNQPDNQNMERLAIYSSYLLIFLMLAGIARMRGFSFSLYNWHTNTYSVVASMVFAYCLGEYYSKYRDKNIEESKLLKNGIWVSILIVALGTSSASNISVAVTVVILILISGKNSTKIFALFGLGIIVLINQLYGDLLFSLLFPGKTTSGVEALGGRMNLWEYYFDLIRQKPFTGWGFAALSRISKLYNIHTHNSLIEIAGGVGYLGLFIFFIYLFRLYYKFLKNIKQPYLVGAVSAVTAGLVNSMSISIIGSPTGAIFLAFIIWNLVGWYALTGINQYGSVDGDYMGDA